MNNQAAKYIQTLQELGPVKWAEGPHGWIGLDGRPIVLTPWQRAALCAYWDHRADVSTFAVSNIKKSGKTFVTSILSGFRWLAYPGIHFAAANDLDQAQARQFLEIREMVQRNPFLLENVKLGRSEMEFILTGSHLGALALDAAGNAGANFLTSSHTEASFIIYEAGIRAWEELTPPPGRFYNLPCLRVADSYAGFTGQSDTWHKIVDRGLAGERLSGEWPIFKVGGLLLFHMAGEEAQERCFRGTDEERETYYQEQRETLRSNTFIRFHYNQRTAGESAFVTEAQWENCYSRDVHALQPGEQVKLTLGADASTSHDFTSLVGLDGADVRLVKIWKPVRIIGIRLGKPTVDIERTIGQEVLDLHAAGQVACVVYDPYQLHSVAIGWQRAGINCIELPQTAQRVEADTHLSDAIISGGIRHFHHPDLDDAIRNAIVVETPRGIRLAKERASRKIDPLIALSMAFSAATSSMYLSEVTCEPNPFYGDYADDETSTFVQLSDGGYIIIPKENAERTHPLTLEAVETCRVNGCPACIQFYDESGYYRRQQEEAKLIAQAGTPDYLEMAKSDYKISQILKANQYEHKHLSYFLKAVARRNRSTKKSI